MSKQIKGQNLRLFLDGVVVAAAKSCKLNYSNEYEDSTTKDTPTGKKEEEFTRCNISISFDYLVGDIAALKTLKDKMKSGAAVAYSVEHTTGDNNDQKTTPAEVLESGKAVFDSFDIDATDRQNVSASGSMHDVYDTTPAPAPEPAIKYHANNIVLTSDEYTDKVIVVTGLTPGDTYVIKCDNVVGDDADVSCEGEETRWKHYMSGGTQVLSTTFTATSDATAILMKAHRAPEISSSDPLETAIINFSVIKA